MSNGSLLSTVQALIQSIRRVKGCTGCSACQDVEDKNTFYIELAEYYG